MGTAIGGLVLILESAVMNSMGMVQLLGNGGP